MKSKVFVLTVVFALSMTGFVFAGIMMEKTAPADVAAGVAVAEDMGAALEEGMAAMHEMGSETEAAAAEAVTDVEVGNKICPVSNEETGKMGPAFKIAHKGKIYSLCCAACAKDFMKDPDGYAKKAEEVVAVEPEPAMAE
ncbi:MAG: hypothetical protein A2787_09960 [Omnitrophica WOR_2 bacterium RIFCSPHIGHO2_01_FULL_48_9]|nr:MAG: hypothetical protein A3D10_09610 [Omnitrophica WOR_2 bacterium RIFCSPHIGHO2_02_FULL_48_11]OGX31588.1 MAG: hypothetical protein A2787_09960 [Omnitrophica WOR_2 bacterium RIFCSPHIGHO2_01_FULL_48_9]